MDIGMTKSYIYTLANRIPHLAFIILLPLAYFEIGGVYFHACIGMAFLLFVVFRIVWGVLGSRYSRFWDFHFKGLGQYLLGIFGKKPFYIAHNPASSIAVILMLFFGVVVCLSGLMLWGEREHGGVFSYLYFCPIGYLKEIHEISANALIFVVIAHICGVVIDKIFHKTDTLNAIFTGYRSTPTDKSVKLTKFQTLFCVFYCLLAFVVMISLFFGSNPLLGVDKTPPPYSYSQAQKLYIKECGSCHITYAPYTLGTKAWEKMMGELENHFGDDASLDEEDRIEIEKFLLANSAQHISTFLSPKIQEESPLVFSQSRLFEKIHHKIPQSAFASKEIKSKANCQNCHQNAQEGYFSKSALKEARRY